MQNEIQNAFFSILFHNVSLFTFPHTQTLTSNPGGFVQSLYLHICVSFRDKSMRKVNDLYMIDISTQIISVSFYLLFISQQK